jgi:hypothetical protein
MMALDLAGNTELLEAKVVLSADDMGTSVTEVN